MKLRIKFEEWQLFCELVRLGSFAATARETAADASNIKRRLDALENKLQQQLFIRNRSGLQLTASGRRLYGRISPLIEATQRNCTSFESTEAVNDVVTTLSCAMPAKFFPGYGERVTRALRVRFPNVTLNLTLYEDDQLQSSLSSHLVLFRADGPLPGARLIGHFPTLVAASEAFVIKHGEPSSHEDLSLHTILKTSSVTHSKTVLIRAEERYPVVLKQERIFRSEDSLINALARDEGIAVELTRSGFLLARELCPMVRLLYPSRSADIPLAIRIHPEFAANPICLHLAQLFADGLHKEHELVSQLL